MKRQDLEAMPMTLKQKSNGKIWKSNGFTTATYDWNCDGDIYKDTVMVLFELNGNGFMRIHEYDMDDFEII